MFIKVQISRDQVLHLISEMDPNCPLSREEILAGYTGEIALRDDGHWDFLVSSGEEFYAVFIKDDGIAECQYWAPVEPEFLTITEEDLQD